MKKLTALYVICTALFSFASSQGKEPQWPLYIYNFGGYDSFSIPEQVSMTRSAGYAGMIVSLTPNQFETFDRYKAEADNTDGFDLHAAFYAIHNKVGILGPQWKKVVDKAKAADINLWLITGKASEKVSEDMLQKRLADIVRYANEQSVPVSLYPHNTNMIDNAEQAVRMIEKLKPLKIDLAFILCHEMRYGNAHRIEEVIHNVKNHIAHVVISGSDTELDAYKADKSSYSSRTLQPLYQGEFDMNRVLKSLSDIGYDGNMGYINHRFDAESSWSLKPSDYLRKSITTYDDWLKALTHSR